MVQVSVALHAGNFEQVIVSVKVAVALTCAVKTEGVQSCVLKQVGAGQALVVQPVLVQFIT